VAPSATGKSAPVTGRVGIRRAVRAEDDGPMTQTEVAADTREGTRARIEQTALDLFTAQGFEQVTIDEIAEAAGTSRRTFFRYVNGKADVVWGDFDAHVVRLAAMLAATAGEQSVLSSICAAYVEVNDYAAEDLPILRQRMRLILTEPALLAHSQVRYADIDRVVAAHVARRTGVHADALVPRLVATSTRAAATTAFEVWLADGRITLAAALHQAFDELAGGFPSLRVTG
jgi:TetR/AcrR family transcriptional regulator, regulator of mycofactocin system